MEEPRTIAEQAIEVVHTFLQGKRKQHAWSTEELARLAYVVGQITPVNAMTVSSRTTFPWSKIAKLNFPHRTGQQCKREYLTRKSSPVFQQAINMVRVMVQDRREESSSLTRSSSPHSDMIHDEITDNIETIDNRDIADNHENTDSHEIIKRLVPLMGQLMNHSNRRWSVEEDKVLVDILAENHGLRLSDQGMKRSKDRRTSIWFTATETFNSKVAQDRHRNSESLRKRWKLLQQMLTTSPTSSGRQRISPPSDPQVKRAVDVKHDDPSKRNNSQFHWTSAEVEQLIAAVGRYHSPTTKRRRNPLNHFKTGARRNCSWWETIALEVGARRTANECRLKWMEIVKRHRSMINQQGGLVALNTSPEFEFPMAYSTLPTSSLPSPVSTLPSPVSTLPVSVPTSTLPTIAVPTSTVPTNTLLNDKTMEQRRIKGPQWTPQEDAALVEVISKGVCKVSDTIVWEWVHRRFDKEVDSRRSRSSIKARFRDLCRKFECDGSRVNALEDRLRVLNERLQAFLPSEPTGSQLWTPTEDVRLLRAIRERPWMMSDEEVQRDQPRHRKVRSPDKEIPWSWIHRNIFRGQRKPSGIKNRFRLLCDRLDCDRGSMDVLLDRAQGSIAKLQNAFVENNWKLRGRRVFPQRRRSRNRSVDHDA